MTSDNSATLYEQARSLQKKIRRSFTSEPIHTRLLKVYSHLAIQQMLNCFNSGELNESKAREFLYNNWHRTKHSLCSYTAVPALELNILLYDLAEHLSSDAKSAIQLLMPDLITESELFADTYPDLTTLSLKNILHTHIIGEGGNYLIPVVHLISLEQSRYEADEEKKGFINPYYDYQRHEPERCWLSEGEQQRLIKHSSIAQAVHDSTLALLQREQEAPDLLTSLRELCRILQINDAHGGIGQQVTAGEGAYLAIVQFNNFYTQLHIEEKIKIPAQVDSEITQLIHYASTANSATQIGSCIGLRREQLAKVIKEHETVLQEITIPSEQQANLKKEARTARDDAKARMEQFLEQKKYIGRDALGITKELLQWLGITFNVCCNREFKHLMNSSAHDINELLHAFPHMKKQINSRFNSYDELIFFFIAGHENKKLKTIVKVLLNENNPLLIRNEKTALFLPALSTEQIILVVNELFNHSPSLANSAYSLSILMSRLSADQKTGLYESFIKEKVPTLIKSSANFRDLIQYLTPIQRSEIYQPLKDNLELLLKSSIDLANILKFLNDGERKEIYQCHKNTINTLIRSGSDFGTTLCYLALNQEQPEQEKTAEEQFNQVKEPPLSLRGTLFELFKDELPILINTADDLWQALLYLPPEHCSYVCGQLQDKFSTIVTSAKQLRKIFLYLNQQQGQVICQYFPKSLSLLVETETYDTSRLDMKGNHLIKSLGVTKEKQIYQYWFRHILDEIKPAQQHANEKVRELYSSLNHAAKQYFDNDYTRSGHEALLHSCQEAITLARPYLRDENDFFKKLILGILTLGLAPAILAIHSKIAYGSFNFSFFGSKEEKAADLIIGKILNNDPTI